MTQSCRILIVGHVQGVFFRDWTVGVARQLGVAGWVRNRSDGSVEALATGDARQLDAFIARMHEGSPPSRVDAVHVEDAGSENVKGFAKRSTV